MIRYHFLKLELTAWLGLLYITIQSMYWNSVYLKMCVIRGKLRFERVEMYVLSEFCCNKLISNVKFSEVIIFRNNPVTGYYFS